MSHNRHENISKNVSFESFFSRFIALILAVLVVLLSSQAQAAINPGTQTKRNPSHILKTNLDVFSKATDAILDWRTPSYELSFDLPSHNRYDSLDLFIKAYPEGNVSRNTPLLISYNGAKAIPLYGKGSQFDAHIRLDPARIRTQRNTIKITYKTPQGQECLTNNSGKWVLNLSNSKLVTKARAKHRTLQITDLKQSLSHPMTAPKKLAIKAFGPNKLALEALIAQGVAQQTPNLPTFQFTTQRSDFAIIIGTYDDIRPYVSDKTILPPSGARILADNAPRPTLVITADTPSKVLELARVFAKFPLPETRRNNTFITEFYAHKAFETQILNSDEAYNLADIGNTSLIPSWRPQPTAINFNITDPKTSSGVVTLNILSPENINPSSRVKIMLNEHSLGYTKLNKDHKSVAFNIKPGQFNASNNQLRIEAEFTKVETDNFCTAQETAPAMLISNKSILNITNNRPTTISDLSRFSASGGPFAKNTAVILTASNNAQRTASLKFLGFAAKQFGPIWADAEYLNTIAMAKALDKNLLIIGPNAMNNERLISAAPSALKTAFNGKIISGPQKIALLQHQASADKNSAFKIAAAQFNKTAQVRSGGIASIFKSPYAHGKMIGIISSDKPYLFSRSIDTLASLPYWNALEGGVMRWNNENILMAQTAVHIPASFVPAAPKPSGQKKWDNIATAPSKWITSMRQKWANKSAKKRETKLKKTIPSTVKQTASSTPAVRPAPVFVPTQVAMRNINAAALPKLRGSSLTINTVTQTIQSAPVMTTNKLSIPSLSQLKLTSSRKIRALNLSTQRKFAQLKTDGLKTIRIKHWLKGISQSNFFMLLLFGLAAFLLLGLSNPKYR